jgi:outer membrane receptor protein involved in Fe transport
LCRQVSQYGTLVLLTRPLLADDVTEIAPVDRYDLRPFPTLMNLARGGFNQAYELQYEVAPPNGGFFRASLFQRDLRNLLVDLQDPAYSVEAAPLVVNSARLQGAEIELERPLCRNWTGGLWGRYASSTNDDAGGLDLPYQPRWTGQARLDYLDNAGYRAALVWSVFGRRFADASTTLGAYNLLDLTFARQFNLHTELFVNVNNVLDRRDGFYQSYPGAGVSVLGGAQYRF